jgi:hypothetical protein
MSYRGNNSFTTMKGFMGDMTVKGDGHEVETMPEMMEGDVTESAELDNALPGGALSAANIKPTDNKTGAPSVTMDDELNEVADKAVQDVAEGYDADVQNLPGPGDREKKGYEVYNDMVAKGAAVHVQPFNRYDVDGSMDMIQKSAESAFNLASENLSPWMTQKGLDNDLTLKHMGFSMALKGDPEDESLEDGYEEDGAPNGEVEEADDDTESTQGENEDKPQTVAAAVDDSKGDSANPAWLGDDGTQKGWDAYNSGIATKGFDLVEKGGVGDFVRGTGSSIGRGLKKLADKRKYYYGVQRGPKAGEGTLRKLSKLAEEHPGVAGGLALGAGGVATGAAGYGAYRGGKALKEDKGFDDDMTVFKGASHAEMVEKGKTWEGVKSAGKWVGRKASEGGKAVGRGAKSAYNKVKNNPGKSLAIASAAGVAGAGGVGYARGGKKKSFDDGMTVFKGMSYSDMVTKDPYRPTGRPGHERLVFDKPPKGETISRSGPSSKTVGTYAGPEGEVNATTRTHRVHATPAQQRQAIIDAAKVEHTAAPAAAETGGRASKYWSKLRNMSTRGKVGAGLGAAALIGGGAYLASRRNKKGFDGDLIEKGCSTAPGKIVKKKKI